MVRIINFLHGVRSNLKFSNRFQVIYDRIFRRNLVLTHYIWKNHFVFICNSRLQDHIALQECFCERAYDKLLDKCSFSEGRASYVNVGANIGAFDVLLLERGLMIEAGVAVELNPCTFLRCLINLQTNGLSSIRAVNAGITGSNGMLSFYPLGLSLSDSIFTKPKAEAEGVQIELLTLETLVERHCAHFKQFDLLKLDCEGAEYAIIRAAPSSLLGKFRYIIIEFHPEPENETVHAAYAKLNEAGFRSQRTPQDNSRFTDIFIRSS